MDTTPFRAENRRQYAYVALLILGAEAKPAIPILTQCIRDRRVEEKEAAAIVLAGIGYEPIGFLTNALNSSEAPVRAAAARGLGAYAEPSPSGFWEVELPSRPPEEVASTAKLVVPHLIPALTDSDHYVRCIAASSLGALAKDEAAARLAVPALVQCLGDPDQDVRLLAAQSLGGIAREAQIAVPALTVLLEDCSGDLRRIAADALGQFGTGAKNAVPMLLRALNDKEVRVRGEVADALRRIDPEAVVLTGAK